MQIRQYEKHVWRSVNLVIFMKERCQITLSSGLLTAIPQHIRPEEYNHQRNAPNNAYVSYVFARNGTRPRTIILFSRDSAFKSRSTIMTLSWEQRKRVLVQEPIQYALFQESWPVHTVTIVVVLNTNGVSIGKTSWYSSVSDISKLCFSWTQYTDIWDDKAAAGYLHSLKTEFSIHSQFTTMPQGDLNVPRTMGGIFNDNWKW